MTTSHRTGQKSGGGVPGQKGGGAPSRWTKAHDAQLRQLHADGIGLNEAARQMGFASSVVSKHAAQSDPPLSWDRAQVEAANVVRSVDAKARRQAAVAEIYDIFDDTAAHAKSARDGGRFKTLTKGEYGSEVQTELDFIPTANRKDLAASMVQLVNAATKLEAIDSDSGVADAVSLLGKMARALGLSDEVDADEDDPDA